MIKREILIFLFFLQAIAAFTQPSRAKLNFNRDWTFKLGDYPKAKEMDFDDSGWEHVGLPHSFSIPYFMSPDFYVGYGWYRKKFDVPAAYKGKKVFVEFEGAFQDAEIFINNTKVGEHKGGYTGFSVDISKVMRQGRNILAVRLNNLWNPRLAPRAGDHVFSGGIYRDVNLVLTDPVHIPWYGTFVTTPSVSKAAASIKLQTEIKNDNLVQKLVLIRTDIYNPDGKKIASVSSKQVIKPGQLTVVSQKIDKIVKPALWHPDHPFLYKAVSSLIAANRELDRYETTFGIRSVHWTADKGFFLNGERYYLLGANVHQDHAGWGDAVSNAGFYRDVTLIKEAGFNFIRGSHYPHDPAFAEACDKKGVLLWSENAFWGLGGFGPEGYWKSSAYPTRKEDEPDFDSSVLQQLGEMIRIFRNHPSVVVWSMCNEPFFTPANTTAPMRELLKKSVQLARTLDPSRSAAIGGAQRPLDENRIDKLGDVAGYNGDGASISVFQNPGIPTIVSEYGSRTSERPGAYDPNFGDLTKDAGKPVYPWRGGQAIWCGFDHGSVAGSNLAKMGIIDYFRIPKRAWYWYRNEYAKVAPPAWPAPGVPAGLKLAADRKAAIADGTQDIQLLITVVDANGTPVSNNVPVKLQILSGPGEFPTGSAIEFKEGSDIRIQDGKAAIELRSWYSGETLIRASSPGIDSAELKVVFKGSVPYVEGITPQAKQREYKRFSRKDNQTSVKQKFVRFNPTFASSSFSNHPAGFAANGDEKTWWQPLASDSIASWTLDTEKGLAVSDITISFPKEGVYNYKVEISENKLTWKLIGDFRNSKEKQILKQIKVPEITGRLIRISFDDPATACLEEVEVTGRTLD